MINYSDSKQKVLAAHKLLQEDSTTKEKFESIKTLLNGVDPKIDETLEKVSKALSDLEKLEHGEVIELSAEHLPENTEKEKRRKKLLFFLIRSWKDLKGEVERVRAELEGKQETSQSQQLSSVSKITAFAKGPLGIVTLIAVLIITVMVFNNQTNDKAQVNTDVSSQNKVQYIEFEGKKIALTELTVGVGPECDQEPHYHAKDHAQAKALDGTLVSDPGGCGFGRVKEVEILEK